jgi:hypothetical protein
MGCRRLFERVADQRQTVLLADLEGAVGDGRRDILGRRA